MDGVKKQWWLEKRTMRGIQMANSLVDWLSEEIKDPSSHQWGWDRVPFFGPQKRTREVDPKWQQRVDNTKPQLQGLITSRARREYDFAGSNIIPIESNLGTKRKIEELEKEEEDEEEEEAEESEEEKFGAYTIWREQVLMTRKYLTDNHRQMKAQGVKLPYVKTYRSFSC